MSNAVEYNKIAISDVKAILSQLTEFDNIDISINSINAGQSRDKIEKVIKAYNQIENYTRSIIQQVEKMLEDVISAVNDVDE